MKAPSVKVRLAPENFQDDLLSALILICTVLIPVVSYQLSNEALGNSAEESREQLESKESPSLAMTSGAFIHMEAAQ